MAEREKYGTVFLQRHSKKLAFCMPLAMSARCEPPFVLPWGEGATYSRACRAGAGQVPVAYTGGVIKKWRHEYPYRSYPYPVLW